MRLFDRFFGKEDRSSVRIKKVRFSELNDWLRGRIEEEGRKSYRDAGPIVDEILASVERIKECADRIERSDCPNSIPKRARKIVLISKPDFVRRIHDSLMGIENSSRENIEEFHRNLMPPIISIGRAIDSQGRYLSVAFGDIIQDITKELKFVVAKGTELKGFIPKNRIYEVVSASIIGLEKEAERMREIDLREKEIRKEIKKTMEKREKLMQSYRNFQHSPEFREFHSLQTRLNELDERKKEVESGIYSYLSPMKRPLKKFKREMKRKDIDAYIKDPVQGFISGGTDIGSIIMDIKKAINSGKLRIKKSELGKIARVEKNIGEIMRLRELHASIESEIAGVSRKLASFRKIGRGRELAGEIEYLSTKLNELKREPEKLKRKKSQIKERISVLKNSIENSLRESRHKVEVEWDIR